MKIEVLEQNEQSVINALIKALEEKTGETVEIVNLHVESTKPIDHLRVNFNISNYEIDSTSIDDQSENLNDNYEYEMFINDKGTPFEINSWIPISNEMIKDPNRIDEYIEKGLLRRIN